MKRITKTIIAGAIAFSIVSTPITSLASTYTIQSGDTYWKISEKFDVSLQKLLEANSVNSDTTLQIGDEIIIPEENSYYTVQSGDTPWIISEKLKVSLNDLLEVNNLDGSSYIYVGQKLKIPSVDNGTTIDTMDNTDTKDESYTLYYVQSGDTLWKISQKVGITLDKLLTTNNLGENSYIYVGQELKITKKITFISNQPDVKITYIDHKVEKGDNFWSISLEYGIQVKDLLKANNATTSTVLNIGDIVKIPVHNVSVMETPGEKYGEYLDWWTGAQYVIPIGAEIKIVDFYTGESFMAKRTTGASHADVETLTLKDTQKMKEIWGGEFSWKSRPAIIEFNGRKIAASVASMPHAGNDNDPGGKYTNWRSGGYGAGLNFDYVKGNGIDGHFDIHFLNSTRHKDGQIDEVHQKNIKISGGITK